MVNSVIKVLQLEHLIFIVSLCQSALKSLSNGLGCGVIFTYFQSLSTIENLFMKLSFKLKFNQLIFMVILILLRWGQGKGFHT
ncbi:hypothetical protein CUC44_16445 [Aeromonas lusitana]|uniref:Uncharacterized protein n=1 Tax=Aeromonas lusitana TaxID=931529 RepID=A0A2M8H6D9_9GAMM|nr:hypothetical protein CUC44_16445 [Aeromonas lusitana]